MLYGLVSELASVDEASDSESSDESSETDPEERARNEALGLGGAGLKAVLSEIKNGLDGANNAGPATGGEVLSILHARMQRMSGDPSAMALHRALVKKAGKPYAQMLVAWVKMGKLDDPYAEFCVKESKFLNTTTLADDYIDQYWERRYTVSLAGIPIRGVISVYVLFE